MFVLCVLHSRDKKDKSHSQDNQNKEEVQMKYRGQKKKIPVEDRFPAPVQTGPGAHPLSCTMRSGYLSRGIKRPGRGVNNQSLSSSEVKERVELYLYSPSGSSWPVLK